MSRVFLRHITTRKLAVVGSGPSAFYTSLNILKSSSSKFQIDIFERNPSPYGLVRYGVAPDHPEVKNCIDRFEDVRDYMNKENNNGAFKYFGNVNIGKDITLKELYESYDGVLYAYGAQCAANNVKFSGSDHPAVIDSFSFVNWYNGHPEYQHLQIPLEKVKEVSVIGVGNVALDIVRILLGNVQRWEKTDISSVALAKLRESKVEKVTMLARRGILDSKFTNKELRELLEMKSEGVWFDGWNEADFKDQLQTAKLDRVNKRRVQLLQKYNGETVPKEMGTKSWEIKYLRSPVGVIVKDDELLKELLVSTSKLEKIEDTGDWKIVNEGRLEGLPTQLVILATGYQCHPLPDFAELGIPFEGGKIPNENGKIVGVENSYCVGWVSNGSKGNINSTVADSMNVADTIVNDLQNKSTEKPGRSSIEKLLSQRNVKPVTWDQWNNIHSEEVRQGAALGKPYEKLDFGKMLNVGA